MGRARGEEGVAMIMAVIILFVLLGLGAALLATAQGQQRSAFNQQSGESGILTRRGGAQRSGLWLSQGWPTAGGCPRDHGPRFGYPTSCNSASNGTSYCPTAQRPLDRLPRPGATCPQGLRAILEHRFVGEPAGPRTSVMRTPARRCSVDQREQSAPRSRRDGAVTGVGVGTCGWHRQLPHGGGGDEGSRAGGARELPGLRHECQQL